MDLSDEFEVPLSLEAAWSVLTDLERVAPCLPGAQLDEVEGEDFKGRVRVKVGPITVEYKGVARLTSRDEEHHVAELRAEGRETRGQGNAAATVRADLSEAGPQRTSVRIDTSLDVSGRVAQLGRGALAEVSTKLLRQFVANLEADLASGDAGPDEQSPPSAPETIAPEMTAAATTASETTGSETTTSEGSASGTTASTRAPRTERPVRAAEPVSMLRLVGPALLKRLGPVVVLGALFVGLRRRRRRTRAQD